MSRVPGPETYDPYSLLFPARTPGPLGRNDAGDPTVRALLGDTPGPLGVKDGAGKLASLASLFGGGEITSPTLAGWVRPPLNGLRPIGQPKSTLCWLTCYQMLYIWKGLDPNTIESKLRGAAGVDYDGACQRGLYDGEFQPAARALGLTAYADASGIDLQTLKAYLVNSPLWVAGEWFKDAKHVRLVVGASDYHVEFFDPWHSPTDGGAESHTHIADIFLHGQQGVRGTDGLKGKYQLQYWRKH